MADTTYIPPAPTFNYVPPPDFDTRQDNINYAYNSSLARLNQQQSQLYNQAGYVNGTNQLDTNNQYGAIQQLLHSEGQGITQDAYGEHARGLSQDSGLGAQRADLLRYAAGAQKNQLGQTFQQNLADIGNNITDVTHTYNTSNTQLGAEEGAYNSQQNAYNDAAASYQKLLASLSQPGTPASYLPGGGAPGSSASPAQSAGPREYIPQKATPKPVAKTYLGHA